MDAPLVIRLVELVTGQPTPYDGEFLVSYDAKAHKGRGEIFTTPIRAKARHFTSAEELFEYYRQEAGMRADGKPNRPLTAWTVAIERADLETSILDALEGR